ncbi:hypothetical protein J8L85_00785 [Maribacter sp. MMG018]|uniref:hypothetical protein n=1 Tax=Maribacter sp. MMG018 TaxID=2822688 RepID=UPI001B38ACBF|nr:hypothetical protein [Maribacter sp. MMG018]MBQ4912951.1 hypothetical protein [Maribacter sp. MMG018]
MLNSGLDFVHIDWLIPLLIGAILLFSVFVWKEWSGNFGKRFIVNVIVGFVSIVSLLCIFLRPTIQKKIKGEAVLVTDGFEKEQLDSLKKAKKRTKYIKYLPGMDLSAQLDSVSNVVVLGYGIRDYDLWQLKNKEVEFLGTKTLKGITELNYGKENTVGNELVVQGRYDRPLVNNRLVLQNSGGSGLDSIVFENNTFENFELKTNLKAEGKYIYKLTEKDSTGKILNIEPLPVIVRGVEVMKILMVNEFPSFETKYLKNFLAENGHEVVVRSKLTKQKYKFEYFNTDRLPVAPINQENLKKFDVLIMDDLTLLSLSRIEKKAISEGVKEDGLGVFVQPGERLFSSSNSMVDFDVKKENKEELSIDWSDRNLEKYPYYFNDTRLKGVPIENYAYTLLSGSGRFGTSLLKNTYQLVLEGNNDVFERVWSTIIDRVGKKSKESWSFSSLDDLVYLNEPYKFILNTYEENPGAIHSKGFQIPLKRSLIIKEEWEGITYPEKKGWQYLYSSKDSTVMLNYFVLDTTEWKSLSYSKMLKHNKLFFNDITGQAPIKKFSQELNILWFFIVFILGMGYLWLEPKLTSLN